MVSNAFFKTNQFSPKIIKLQNGQIVQANINEGIWEINKKNNTILFWKFNPEYSAPLSVYSGDDNKRIIDQARQNFNFKQTPSLLFPSNKGIEFSRSKMPFSAIACFTDHCDFDTSENLIIQRDFFKRANVKTTKGFFLNHICHR